MKNKWLQRAEFGLPPSFRGREEESENTEHKQRNDTLSNTICLTSFREMSIIEGGGGLNDAMKMAIVSTHWIMRKPFQVSSCETLH